MFVKKVDNVYDLEWVGNASRCRRSPQRVKLSIQHTSFEVLAGYAVQLFNMYEAESRKISPKRTCPSCL